MRTLAYLIIAILGVAVAQCLTGCTTETVTTRTTSAKGHVVETVTVTKKADPAALSLAGTVATLYAPPRPRIVREEKSGPVRRHLFSWRGRQEMALTDGTKRISKDEIEQRRKP